MTMMLDSSSIKKRFLSCSIIPHRAPVRFFTGTGRMKCLRRIELKRQIFYKCSANDWDLNCVKT